MEWLGVFWGEENPLITKIQLTPYFTLQHTSTLTIHGLNTNQPEP